MLLLCFVERARADEIHVCVRPPSIPANVGRWAYTPGVGTLLTSNAEVFAMMSHGRDIYIFDPQAPPAHTRLLPLPHNKLECPAWAAPAKPPDPPKPAALSKDDAPEDDKRRSVPEKAERKTDKGEAPDPLPKPIAPPPKEERRPSQCALPGDVLPRRTVLPTETVLPTRTVLPTEPLLPTRKSILPTKGPRSPISSTGTGTGNGSGTKKGEEKSPAEKAAEQIALAGSLANLMVDEDIHDPNGKPFGIPGGLNPYGPNNPLAQAMAGTVLLVTGVLSAAGFEQKLRQAIQVGNPS